MKLSNKQKEILRLMSKYSLKVPNWGKEMAKLVNENDEFIMSCDPYDLSELSSLDLFKLQDSLLFYRYYELSELGKSIKL